MSLVGIPSVMHTIKSNSASTPSKIASAAKGGGTKINETLACTSLRASKQESKTGTLTYEAVDQLVQAGLGQSTCVGIGGDPIIGTSMKDLLEMFETDDDTEAVVLIGEIGGSMELEAAEYVREHMNKPVVGFIAGQTAPPGRRMGHAGAIVSGADESAAAKKVFMKECGLVVVESPANIGKTVATILK